LTPRFDLTIEALPSADHVEESVDIPASVAASLVHNVLEDENLL